MSSPITISLLLYQIAFGYEHCDDHSECADRLNKRFCHYDCSSATGHTGCISYCASCDYCTKCEDGIDGTCGECDESGCSESSYIALIICGSIIIVCCACLCITYCLCCKSNRNSSQNQHQHGLQENRQFAQSHQIPMGNSQFEAPPIYGNAVHCAKPQVEMVQDESQFAPSAPEMFGSEGQIFNFVPEGSPNVNRMY